MSPDFLHGVVQVAITVAVMLFVFGQCRKPHWGLGRLIAMQMNAQHSGVTNWGLAHVPIEKSFTVLDVGCGGGRTVEKLANAASEGRVFGIDYSTDSVATARRTNARRIEEGRVDIRQASVSELPFPDGTFDVVTAVETHYYWPDFTSDLREIRRVLEPGGKLAIIAETYKGRRFDVLYRPVMTLLLRATYLSLDEHRDALVAAGFVDVEVFEERSKGWMCATGVKPPAAS